MDPIKKKKIIRASLIGVFAIAVIVAVVLSATVFNNEAYYLRFFKDVGELREACGTRFKIPDLKERGYTIEEYAIDLNGAKRKDVEKHGVSAYAYSYYLTGRYGDDKQLFILKGSVEPPDKALGERNGYEYETGSESKNNYEYVTVSAQKEIDGIYYSVTIKRYADKEDTEGLLEECDYVFGEIEKL